MFKSTSDYYNYEDNIQQININILLKLWTLSYFKSI